MPDLFASAKAVFRRANHHIDDMDRHLKTFTPDKPYTLVVEQDAETGDYVQKLRFSPDFSHDVSCILFDAVNNMRASLDQMTYAIATKHRPTRNPDDFAPFPFCKDSLHWPNLVKGLRAKDEIPVEIISVFERFKPYKGGNDILWAVNRLANIKKHAILLPVWFGGTKITIPAGSDAPPFAVTPKDRAQKDEIEIFRSPKQPNLHPNIEIAYNIVIDHPEQVIQGKSPVALLKTMRREIIQIMLGTEDECRRIGLIS